MKAVVLAATVALAACGPQAPGIRADRSTLGGEDWPVFRGTPQLTGVASGQLPTALVSSWSVQVGSAVLSSPVVAAGRVFVGSEGGVVHCLDLTSGATLWQRSFSDAVDAPPLVVGSLLIVGTLGGDLVACDAATGDERWRYHSGGKITGSANVLRNAAGREVIVVGSYDAKLHAVDADDGHQLWTVETSSYINGSPAVLHASVLFAGCDALLHHVTAEGVELAAVDVGSYAAASPAAEDDHVYIGTYGGELLAVDLTRAKVQWRYGDAEQGAPIVASAAVGKDVVVIGDRDGRIVAVERASGTLRWSVTTGAEVDASPLIIGDAVLAPSADGRLYALELDDGRLRWRLEVGGAMVASPAVAGGRIIVATEEGRVEAYAATP